VYKEGGVIGLVIVIVVIVIVAVNVVFITSAIVVEK